LGDEELAMLLANAVVAGEGSTKRNAEVEDVLEKVEGETAAGLDMEGKTFDGMELLLPLAVEKAGGAEDVVEKNPAGDDRVLEG